MKTLSRLSLLFAWLACLWLGTGPLLAYSYGPACQWIRVVGKAEIPEEARLRGPLQFSITYQLPHMEAPATLLTNFPLEKPEFKFVFAGFREDMDDAILVSPMFFFGKEIVFRYYVKSSDGRWKSDFGESTYVPQDIPQIDVPAKRDKEYLCKSELDLGILKLKRAR